MKVRKEGATAAGALLGVNVASVLALTTQSAITPLQRIALLCCAISIPLLSYSVCVELLKVRSPFEVHAYMLFIGTAAGIAGFGFALTAAYLAAGLVFGILSVLVIGLTAMRPT